MIPGRVTLVDVQSIMEIDPIITNIDNFINSANELVTELCAPSGVSANRLKMIELWLTAHFITVMDPRNLEEDAESMRAITQGKTDKGFESSIYGQQAMKMDTSGALAAYNNAQRSAEVIPPIVANNIGIVALGGCKPAYYYRGAPRAWW